MRKRLAFSKLFIPAVILSSILIITGIVGYITRGINFGLDYKPGLIEEIKIAKPAVEISYEGKANVLLDFASAGIDLVVSGSGSENETKTFLFENYDTIEKLVAALNEVSGVKASANEFENDASSLLFTNASLSNKLSSTPYPLYVQGKIESNVTQVRDALSSLSGISVLQLGNESDGSYQIRFASSAEEKSNDEVASAILEKLEAVFGSGNIVLVRTDFIGTSFSHSIALQSTFLLIGALAIIWIYATIRFHWDFALAAIIALLHDALIMLSFIVWAQVEFSTMTVAAILTIIGYSINATIVILDRERDLLPLMKDAKRFVDIVNQALTDTLSRSIITTLTTMFAATSLYIFTTGDIENFALALLVGLASGCYSSIFISSAFISSTRLHWKPEFGIHHSLKTRKGFFDTGVSV